MVERAREGRRTSTSHQGRYRGPVSSAVAATVLAYIPSPDRGVWYLGPIPIRAYALFIIAGIVVAVLWGERRFVARGGRPGTVTDVAVFAVPFGLVGGRLYHVATDWQTYFGPGGDPLGALRIWQGGLGIWGAIALGGVGALIGCRRRGVPLPFFADAVAPGIVVAQAIGRLGNYFNQELYGDPTTLPWGLEIYRRVDPATGVPDALGGVALDRTPIEIVQPTFLYELIWNLLVAGLVVWADRRFRLGHGRAFAVYVAGYTAGRFVIEQLRSDYATRVFGDIRINVVVAAVVFVGAVAYIAAVRKPREVLTGSAAAPPADDVAADLEPSVDVTKRRPDAGATARMSGAGTATALMDPDVAEEELSAAAMTTSHAEPAAVVGVISAATAAPDTTATDEFTGSPGAATPETTTTDAAPVDAPDLDRSGEGGVGHAGPSAAAAPPAVGDAASADAVPMTAAPMTAAPTNTAPTQTAPTEAAGTGAAATETAPTGAAATGAAATETAPTGAAATGAAGTGAAATGPAATETVAEVDSSPAVADEDTPPTSADAQDGQATVRDDRSS
jgi:prolipoprotein diacylglyceryl transferase